MSERAWRRLRWLPAAMLALIGALLGTYTWDGGPSGCLTGIMSDYERVEQVGRSWFPPRVACQFTYQGHVSIEQQAAWEYYLPAAFLIGAGLCAWFAARHRAISPTPQRRPWRHIIGVLAYWPLVLLTLGGLIAMWWRVSGNLDVLPLGSIPALSVWTLQWFWTTTAWPGLSAASGSVR